MLKLFGKLWVWVWVRFCLCVLPPEDFIVTLILPGLIPLSLTGQCEHSHTIAAPHENAEFNIKLYSAVQPVHYWWFYEQGWELVERFTKSYTNEEVNDVVQRVMIGILLMSNLLTISKPNVAEY